ncbi:MAG: hypothetical protein LAO04_00350 [Acidobacteriia bacterium]|nr:hypothetical protein [Terriglobia bacterium]
MTVDEELNKLEDAIRRLKVEYEVYFNGGAPRPPHDTLFRVENLIKRYSTDQSKLNISQRFRFSALVQKYAVNNQLCRRKLQEKEEGRSLTGMPRRPVEAPVSDGVVRVVCSDPGAETGKVEQLLRAMRAAKRQVGERPDGLDAATFRRFIQEKTKQVKAALNCDKVQFSVSIEEGKVKFKATKAD